MEDIIRERLLKQKTRLLQNLKIDDVIKQKAWIDTRARIPPFRKIFEIAIDNPQARCFVPSSKHTIPFEGLEYYCTLNLGDEFLILGKVDINDDKVNVVLMKGNTNISNETLRHLGFRPTGLASEILDENEFATVDFYKMVNTNDLDRLLLRYLKILDGNLKQKIESDVTKKQDVELLMEYFEDIIK